MARAEGNDPSTNGFESPKPSKRALRFFVIPETSFPQSDVKLGEEIFCYDSSDLFLATFQDCELVRELPSFSIQHP